MRLFVSLPSTDFIFGEKNISPNSRETHLLLWFGKRRKEHDGDSAGQTFSHGGCSRSGARNVTEQGHADGRRHYPSRRGADRANFGEEENGQSVVVLRHGFDHHA